MNLLDKLFSQDAQRRQTSACSSKNSNAIRRRSGATWMSSKQRKQQKVKEAVTAKKGGKQEVLRDIFREMRQVEIDNGYVNNDLRRISLAKTALTSFLRKMEMLEKKKDRKSLQNLIVRFKDSAIQKAIDTAEVDDDTFNDMLEEILGEEELSRDPGESEGGYRLRRLRPGDRRNGQGRGSRHRRGGADQVPGRDRQGHQSRKDQG